MSSVAPLFGAFEEPVCLVSRTKDFHSRYSGLCGELHVAISSKESWDPSKLKGEKILLSGLLVEFSVSAGVLSRRKG
jgi:hypothetical protein